MPLLLANRVVQSFTTGGTGSKTLLPAPAGSQGFAAVFGTGTGNKFWAVAEDLFGNWEYGLYYMSDSTTLVNVSVLGGTNGTSAVNWPAGTVKTVFCDLPAERVPLRDKFNIQPLIAASRVDSGSSLTLTAGEVIYVRLTANATLTLPTLDDPTSGIEWSFIVDIVQDGTGGRTLAFAVPGGTTLVWDNSSVMPPVSSAIGKRTRYGFTKRADETVYLGSQLFYGA